MVAVDHTHEPSPNSFDRVIHSFATAAVLNIDKSQGIHLYVDYGQNGGEGGDALTHFDTIAYDQDDNPDVLFSQFYNNNFSSNRKWTLQLLRFRPPATGDHKFRLGSFKLRPFIRYTYKLWWSQ